MAVELIRLNLDRLIKTVIVVFLQAAAAMCVGMGSFRDPLEAHGLAHFLGMFWSYYTCISELHYSVLCYLERFECLYFIELNRHLQTCITFPVVYILF